MSVNHLIDIKKFVYISTKKKILFLSNIFNFYTLLMALIDFTDYINYNKQFIDICYW